MKRIWTKEQESAINATNGSVLVSAAAGSGKTAVLTERVITLITNRENPVDIDKLLIVTFTKSAAQEMKERISRRIAELIHDDPNNLNLHRQQVLLKNANIGTIHSFCFNLVKENFFKLNVSPKIKIANDGEIKILRDLAMKNTLKYFFENDSSEFKAAADLFTNEKNDNELSKVINQIYFFTRSIPFPNEWLNRKLEIYNLKEEEDSIWEKYVNDYAKSVIEDLIKISDSALSIVNSNEKIKEAYYEKMFSENLSLKSIYESILAKVEYNKIAEIINSLKFENLSPLREKNLEFEKSVIKNKRQYIKDMISDLKNFYLYSREEIFESAKEIRSVMSAIFDAVNYYDSEIKSRKLLQNIVEFSDLEHMALNLLTSKTYDGKFIQSELALDISNKFTEVMIDEYQDINEIQNMIFKMITSNEKNIFMVGDVKQSIYRFRQSNPKIFLRKKEFCKPYDVNNNDSMAKVLLSKNFRSSHDVIKGVNLIFSNIMSKKVGDIEYNDEEKLISGLQSEKSNINDSAVTLNIIDSEGTGEDKDILEAKVIAKTIIKMISEGYEINVKGLNRKVTYGDFCILLRSANTHAHKYANLLFECGIPVWSQSQDSFLHTEEISTMISLLKVINNPTDDVHLIATMVSAIFGFSMDKILEIRMTDRNVPFYFALKKFLEENEDENELKNFIEKIDFYRTLSNTMSCDEIINYIYDDTNYPSVCFSDVSDGKKKKANLILFLEYAQNFDDEFHMGISGFLDFVEGISEKGGDFQSASVTTGSAENNKVKIMSIHKSKGLEFPICIVAGCSKRFANDSDQALLDDEMGIGIRLKDESGMILNDNLIRESIMLKNKTENISEEMRILYVALTRAMQKLIFVACPQGSLKNNVFSKFSVLSGCDVIPNIMVQNSSTFLDWLLLILAKSNLKDNICSKLGIEYFDTVSENDIKNLDWEINLVKMEEEPEESTEKVLSSNDDSNDKYDESTYKNAEIDEKLLEILNYRLNFKYPNEYLINLPIKVSASEMAKNDVHDEFIATSYPEFLSKKGISPLHKGTAMHKFMCYSNFDKLTSETGIYEEAKRLLNIGFLSSSEYDSLDTKAISSFANSVLFKRIIKSDFYSKEHRFSVNIPAKELFPEVDTNKNIVMQGAVDCMFKEGDEYVLIDYKTDKIKNIESIYEKYKKQLEIYKYAIESTTNKNVKELIIYSFFSGEYLSFNC